MDDFGGRQQSQNPFFDVAQQSLSASWSARPSHLVYDTLSRNHAISPQEVRNYSDVPSSQFFPDGDFVDPLSNDAIDTWSNPQSISIHTPIPYLAEDRSVLLPVATAPDILGVTNPIDQFVKDSDHPWIPSGVVSIGNQIRAPYYSTPDFHNSPFNQGPGSDHPLSDSGYQTLAAPSDTGRSYHGFSAELPPLAVRLQHLDMTSARGGSQFEDGSDDGPDSPDQSAIVTSSRMAKSTRGGKKTCDQCKKELKCPSDFKKHMLVHEKVHKCEVPGCSRTEGFGTVNDLDRHKASVHKILKNTRKFKCAAPGCKSAEKIWPRLDNFKQHLERMHKEINVIEIIEQSEARAKEATHSSSATAIDNDLDGVGTGAGSNVQAIATMDLDELETNQQKELPFVTNVPSRPPNEATKAPARRQTVQRTDPLRELSVVAAMQPNLPSSHAEDPTCALAIIGSVVSRSLSASDHLSRSDAKVRILKQVQHALVEGISQHGSTNGRDSSDEENLPSRSSPVVCPHPGCKKEFKRRCELNKHKKRHTLPYVCTALGCSHRSGSKSDWQRHERTCGQHGRESFHDQNDTVRVCLELDSSSATGKCGFMHTSQQRFETHLRETHHIDDDTMLQQRMLHYQPPDHGPGFGWCGFCVALVQWAEHVAIGDRKGFQEGYGKFTDRADHIDRHVTKEGKNMEHYVNLEFHLRKEDAKKDKLQRWFRAEHRAPGCNPRISDYVPANPRKRRRGADGYESSDDEHKKKINEATWSCCQCGTTQLYNLYGRCSETSCDHTRCHRCEDGMDAGTLKHEMKTELVLPGRIDHRPPWDAKSKYGLMAS